MLLFGLALLLGLNFLFYAEDLLLEILALPRRRRFEAIGSAELRKLGRLPARRFAVLVPFFRPGGDFTNLIYDNHAVFLGVESSDAKAWAAARALEQAHPEILVIPQESGARRNRARAWSKMAEQVLASEKLSGFRFEAFLLLEGSDAISPEALLLLNRELAAADLVQLPLLPHPGRPLAFGTGAYADEAADLHRELSLRAAFRGVLPTRGSGTALSRALLEALLARHAASFAHSYSLGVNAIRLGFRARAALASVDGRMIGVSQAAPDSLAWAIRRRARFAFEAGVEGWQDFGFGANARERYFFWRDRRWVPFSTAGLLLSIFFLAHALFAGEETLPALPLWVGYLSLVNISLAALRLSLRVLNCRRAYGWRKALLVPLRTPVFNFVQSVAQWRALGQAWRLRASTLGFRATSRE